MLITENPDLKVSGFQFLWTIFPVFVNGTPKSFTTVFSYQIIDGLLVFIHLHDGSPLPARLWKRVG